MATKMSQGASEATNIAGKVSALQASAKQAVESGNIPSAISSLNNFAPPLRTMRISSAISESFII